MKRIISIDLPWSANNFTAATYYELSDDGLISNSKGFSKKLGKRTDQDYFQEIKTKLDAPQADYILIDIPIGGTSYNTDRPVSRGEKKASSQRPVERAFHQSQNIFSSGDSNIRIGYPKFQGGENIANEGLKLAKKAKSILGHDRTSVIEIFPQITVPALIKALPKEMSFIDSIGAHKKSRTNKPDLMLAALNKLLNTTINDEQGKADLCDSILGALPLIDLLTSGKFLGSDIVWLLNDPGEEVIHPWTVKSSKKKKLLRPAWMKDAEVSDFTVGVMEKGILTYRLS